jgi:hypothetical protein
LKRFFAILILTGVLFQSLGKVIIMINFELNRKSIAETLCIKKEIKGNCCKGKCHLKKQLDEDDKRTEGNTTISKDKSETQFFSQVSKLIPSGMNLSYINNYISMTAEKTSSSSVSIFHPPRA